MVTVDEFRAAAKWVWPLRDRRAACPHCGARLGWAVPVVIATRHCHRCGGRVLEDPEPDPPADGEDGPVLPTDGEFQVAAEKFANRLGCVAVVGVLGWGLAVVLACVLSNQMMMRPRAWGNPPIDPAVFPLGLFVPPLAIGLTIWLLTRRGRLDWRIVCRHCRTLLHGFVGTVLTTRRCPNCGRKAVEDPGPDDQPIPPPAHPPLTRAEFVARLAARRRVTRRAWVVIAAILGGLVVPVVTPLIVAGRFEAERAAAARVGWRWADALVGCCPVLWVVASLAASLTAAAWYERRRHRRFPLECPFCREKFLNPGLVLAGRRCDRCHEPVVVDPGEVVDRSDSGL